MDQARRDEFRTMVLGALSALYNAALRMVRSDQEAEDLVQETYLHAFEHAEQLESLAACKVWLFRIMRNCFISQRRSAHARPELVLIEGELEKSPAANETALQLERATLARFSRSAIENALGRLPEDMRTAVVMCDVEGFSYRDISEILGCPVGTVRSRVARARGHLMKALAAEAAALCFGKGRQP